MLVPALAALGLAGIIVGILALRTVSAIARRETPPRGWRSGRAIAFAAGGVLAVLSWSLRETLSYAGEGPGGPGTVVGLPFFVAFVDATGQGGVSFLTVPLALLNAAFWFLVPQLGLALYGILRLKERSS